MSAKKKIFIANWKMQFSFDQSCAFIQNNYDALEQLAQEHTIIICPTFPAIHTLATLCQNSPMAIGAQNVSRHPFGAYTGEVSAQSLAEAGCTYCLIGHSEVRQHMHETNIDIEHKLKELIKHSIIPIICLGETKEQHDQRETLRVLQEQLYAHLNVIANQPQPIESYIIAYEPVWAIGNQEPPALKTLNSIFAWIHKQCSTMTNVPFFLVYGGNANATNAASLLNIKHVDGLLLGRASLDIEALKTVIA